MIIKHKTQKEFKEGRGYTKEDWDGVNSPELTKEELANMKPAKEVMPKAFFEAMVQAKRARGRPKVEEPKEAVTLRLSPQVIARYKAKGKNWRSEMTKALEKTA